MNRRALAKAAKTGAVMEIQSEFLPVDVGGRLVSLMLPVAWVVVEAEVSL